MPDALAADLVALQQSTDRLMGTLEGLDDAAARRPSLLPGWSVGHVLTHLARNAEIESGAGRSGDALADDVATSAARLRDALERLDGLAGEHLDRLLVFGPARPGAVPDTPAGTLPAARRRELEIHHVDLDLGYAAADWPADFVERTLLFVHGRSGAVDVVGEPADVLAWRLGRGSGPTVRRLDGTEPGEPPPW